MAANIFTGAVSNAWNNAGNWSLGAIPTTTAVDTATLNASSPSCTITSSAVCNNIDFTGYTNTLNFNGFNLTASGNVVLGASMLTSGTGTLNLNSTSGTGTFTSNGKVWTSTLAFLNNSITTLTDNLISVGAINIGSSTGTTTINGFQIEARGGITSGATSGSVSGTTLVLVTAAATISSGTTTGYFGLPLTINAPGQTVTLTGGSSTFRYRSGTFTYIAGNIVVPAALVSSSTSTTFDCSAITWNDVTLTASSVTYTFLSDLNCAGLLTVGNGSSGSLTCNGANFNCTGGVKINFNTGNIIGTTALVLKATQTYDLTLCTTGVCLLPLEFNAPGGTITVNSSGSGGRIVLGLFKITAGTMVTNAGTTGPIGTVSTAVFTGEGDVFL